MNFNVQFTSVAVLGLSLTACPDPADPDPAPVLAKDIYGPLGAILPTATDDQRATFERGLAVATKRFDPQDGLGPLANVSFCASCHEKPVFGGSAPRYRDFFLTGTQLADGSFIPGSHSGVLTAYGFHGAPTRPTLDAGINVIAHRNAIPFFGIGLIAELSEAAILANVDEHDADGDGISGRPNYDRGFVGRFGRKAQTVSIEGFIRGPLNNHLGVTSDPLTEAQKAKLPVPSAMLEEAGDGDGFRQAAAPDEPLFDDDDVPDPELQPDELFDLVSFAMLLAAPEPEDLSDNELGLRGRDRFNEIGCADCHVPTLEGPRGLVPLYSDLLIHDMGEALADGVAQGLASASEFRTQPLWGIVAVGPYLHDGRADTLDQAIRWHGGEGTRARDGYVGLTAEDQGAVLEFLASLGGREQISSGLLPPATTIPSAGDPGCPTEDVLADPSLLARFTAGRELFDRDITIDAGLGPLFNGDGCRACHFDPVIGGSGPVDLNVMRHGTIDALGEFTAPSYGTILHKLAIPGVPRPEHTPEHNLFETRQTPSLLGLGALESIDADDILALQDPDDLNGDGIRGVAHIMADGQLGRFGWKAQVPSLREFTRDGLSAEVGLTVPDEPGFSFGALVDDDDVADPEVDSAYIDTLTFFIASLAAPEPVLGQALAEGLAVFEDIGCDRCHVVELPGAHGPVRAYTDLLLHVVATDDALGIVDGQADQLMFRTAPLWGLRFSAPYMHDGAALTVDDAIMAHAGEADAVRLAYEGLSAAQQGALLDFLESL